MSEVSERFKAIERARTLYPEPKVRIDYTAETIKEKDGTWVSALVWVSDTDAMPVRSLPESITTATAAFKADPSEANAKTLILLWDEYVCLPRGEWAFETTEFVEFSRDAFDRYKDKAIEWLSEQHEEQKDG